MGKDMLMVHGVIILISFILVLTRKLPVRDGILLIILAVLGGCHMKLQEPVQAVVKRPAYGEEAKAYTLYFQENEDKTDIYIHVPAKKFTDAELDEMAAEVFDFLFPMILAGNDSAEKVTESLKLSDEMRGYPFQIVWTSEDEQLISSDGVVRNEELKAPVICRLTAELICGDYAVMQDFYVNVWPQYFTDEELRVRQVMEDIASLLGEQEYTDTIALPIEISGGRLYGSIPDPFATLLWPFLGIAWLFLRRLRTKEAIKKAECRRKESLAYMYSDFVNQLVLYLSAGLTIRSAMERIMIGLQENCGRKEQVLYQELAGMFHGLESGISEKQAYQSFGKRCGHGGYKKLMALMIQTVFVGGKGVLVRLEELEAEAFIQRKEYARAMGEEASTKLLIPMIMLLAIVMLILVVPGFYGLNI